MVSEVKWTQNKFTTVFQQNGKSKYTVCTRPQNGLDWGCRLTPVVQRLERGDRTPTRHGAISHQKSWNQTQRCQPMGWKRGKDISGHSNQRQKGQSKDYVGHTWGLDQTSNLMKLQHAFTHLRALNQGNKTLSTYIQEVRRMVDLCNFACVWETARTG